MNNLLKTLTESQVKASLPDTDLVLLLTTVKEGRRQSYDAKLSDPFYESLEGLLVDLRTVTMDNRDAEAFLKPVSKVDVPDYYEVIANPMDLHTMLKKVKQKTYKSKKEFKDDLDLIWSNCFTYNATENHPLRICAERLKYKAEKLLKNITERKERTDPIIPSNLHGGRPKLNGLANGHSYQRSPPTASKSSHTALKRSTSFGLPRRNQRDLPEAPAIVRTPSGMALFSQLDREMDGKPGSSQAVHGNDTSLAERLDELILIDNDSTENSNHSPDDSSMVVDGEVGEKRKMNGAVDHRPRKRARFVPHLKDHDGEIAELWWNAAQTDSLFGNGIPEIGFPSSEHTESPNKTQRAFLDPPILRKVKRKRRKKDPPERKTMLSLMNDNIRTMKRVRRTHVKFAALNLNVNAEDGEAMISPPEVPADDLDDHVDEKPWRARGVGTDVDEQGASDCVHWMGMKVLEHAGFQGTSKAALNVLAGVTSEYLLNVGRTIRFLCDRYSRTMTAEEIILHTLFESGTAKIQNLERYIKDDVIRYGARLGDLEKKLASAYAEATSVDALDDEALFGEGDDEEDGAFVMGNFADAFGEDFFGLRELGIASEHNMSSLSIPKRLLSGKGKGANKLSSSAAAPAEPPPPFPPPPPFVPLSSAKVEDQIGLLQSYYQGRISAKSTSVPALSNPSMLNQYGSGAFGYGAQGAPTQASPDVKPPPVILPDDLPNPLQAKMGPLGQILKSGPSGGVSKKKNPKPKESDVGFKGDGATVAFASQPSTRPSESPTKKKSTAAGPGSGGASAKKKAKVEGSLPPAVMASA